MRSAITKEIDKLEDIQLSINHASIFFDKTSKELLLNVPTSIIHISEYGLLTLCSSLDIEPQDFDYCLTLVSIVNNDKFLDNMDAFIQLLNILKIMDNEELEFIEEYLNDLDDGIKSYEPVKAFTKEKNISYSKELKTIWILLAIIEENYDSKFNILKDLIKLLKIVKEENINKYINSIKFTKECPIKLCINGVVDEMHSECLKETQNIIEKKYHINELIKELLEKQNKLKRFKRKYNKIIDEKINKLNNLISFLDKEEKVFINVEDFDFEEYSFYPELLLEILKRNNKVYEDLKQENDSKNITTIKEIDKVFYTYQIPINNFKKEDISSLLSNQTLDELDKKLAFLKQYLSFVLEENNLPKILKTNIEILKSIAIYYQTEKLSRQTILSLNILTNEEIYTKVSNNIKLLPSQKNINEKVLLLDPNYLRQALLLAKKYSLDLNNEQILLSLTNKYIFDYLDILIELNIIDILKTDQSFLNGDLPNIIKRIIICQKLNIKIINKNNKLLSMIKTGNNFYLNENELDEYIENSVINFISSKTLSKLTTSQRLELSNPPKELDIYEKNGNYLINGIIISKNKVLRNLTICDNLEEAILFGSILGLNDILKIKETIQKKQK